MRAWLAPAGAAAYTALAWRYGFRVPLTGVAVMGVAAVVGLAKTQGLLPRAAPVLAQMRANGYFIGPGVVAAVLARVGEAD